MKNINNYLETNFNENSINNYRIYSDIYGNSKIIKEETDPGVTNVLNALLISTPFTIILWSNNILIYLISIFYIIDTIRYQDNKLLRLSFCIFSILTTIVVQTFIINFIASLFGIF